MKRIYIISNLKAGIIKIGVAKDCQKRMKALQCCCGQKLFLWHQSIKLENAYEIEQMMHKHFQAFRTYGEWFKVGRKAAVVQLGRFIRDTK